MSGFMSKFMSFSRINGDSKVAPFVVLLLAVTVLASACNLLLPSDSIFYVSTYTITLLGKYSVTPCWPWRWM